MAKMIRKALSTERIIAFDVETPNASNNRICSIGISIIENGCISDSREYLVNPECDFFARNIAIHGITPNMVKNAPAFPEIWEEIKPLFCNNIVAAHNAAFDLCVLNKTLQHYKIDYPDLVYICTLRAAEDIVSGCSNYKLNTLCDYYGIALRHHRAGSDSNACASLICKWQQAGFEVSKYSEQYHFFDRCECAEKKRVVHRSAETEALTSLRTIVEAIIADGKVVDAEVSVLDEWMQVHSDLAGNYPFDRIYQTLEAVLSDGVLDQEECDYLFSVFSQMLNPVTECSSKCVNSDLSGKLFCLSGEFDFGTKDEVTEYLMQKGAISQTGVTKNTDYLFVGAKGSIAWSAGNYGSKVKKAMELQEKGNGIQIIREQDYDWC